MHKPFDFEAAKRGEPVEFMSGNAWFPAHFIGVSAEGYMVIQHQIIDSTKMTSAFCCQKGCLRMAPKKVTVRYRNYKLVDAGRPAVSMICDEPGWDSVEEIESKSWFRGWIHADWQEVEIPQ